jgi:ABC-type antimicrobial peptide transport system permease subunit
MMKQVIVIFMAIIMLALAFGIVNNMLMAVLERKRELGVLMALGMNRWKVFFMIMSETLMMSLFGGVLGVALAFFSIDYFGELGITLTGFEQGLAEFGMENTIYPFLDSSSYGLFAVMVVTTALVAGLFPARFALQNNPVESIRSI